MTDKQINQFHPSFECAARLSSDLHPCPDFVSFGFNDYNANATVHVVIGGELFVYCGSMPNEWETLVEAIQAKVDERNYAAIWRSAISA